MPPRPLTRRPRALSSARSTRTGRGTPTPSGLQSGSLVCRGGCVMRRAVCRCRGEERFCARGCSGLRVRSAVGSGLEVRDNEADHWAAHDNPPTDLRDAEPGAGVPGDPHYPPSPPPPPLPMFEADSRNFAPAPSVPRGFTLQNFRPAFRWGPSGEEGGGGSQPTPPPPLRIHRWGGGRSAGASQGPKQPPPPRSISNGLMQVFAYGECALCPQANGPHARQSERNPRAAPCDAWGTGHARCAAGVAAAAADTRSPAGGSEAAPTAKRRAPGGLRGRVCAAPRPTPPRTARRGAAGDFGVRRVIARPGGPGHGV